MYDEFITIVKSLSQAPDDQLTQLLKITKPQELVMNENFITAGEVPTKFAFNLRGLFRYYYIDEKGNEYTKGFFPENTFLSSYSAMIQNRRSYFTIEALENARILVIEYRDWQQIFKEYP